MQPTARSTPALSRPTGSAPAVLYVAERLQAELSQPVWGWFGRRDQFLMEHGYVSAPGIAAWLSGTPGVLGLAAVEEGAKLTAEAGIPAIRQKAREITEYAIALHDERLAPLGFTLGSPRDSLRRGSHVSIRRADAAELCRALTEAGVLTDFRMPDTIRLGCSPLTTSYAELWDGVDRICQLAG